MTDMSTELNFETIARGRKADKGHTLVAVADSTDGRGFSRTHAKCQCGKVYSGYGDGGWYGHERHLRNELAKIEETS